MAQQFSYYLMDTEKILLKERKRGSLPGSVISTQNVVFDRKDVRFERLHSKINMAVMTGMV